MVFTGSVKFVTKFLKPQLAIHVQFSQSRSMEEKIVAVSDPKTTNQRKN